MTQNDKKIPERKCVACGEMKPKGELRRVVRTPDGTICLDKTGKTSGRGAYLCADPKCLARARKGDRIGYALGCKADAAVYDALEDSWRQT